MPSYSLTNILAHTRSVIRDSASTFITDADITVWANQAQEDLAQRTKTIRAETTGTISTSTLAAPAGFLEVISFRLGTDDDVEFIDDETFWSWSDSGDDPGHTLGRYFNGNIEIYPTPDSGTAYVLRYIKSSTDLSAGADVSVLPIELHPRIVYFCQAQAKLKESDTVLSQHYMGMYEDGLPARPLGRTRLFPGPLNLRLAPNLVWDGGGTTH